MDEVTWNENVIATDSSGRIGYWHPGLHQLRPKRWDERLPYPGDGRAEWTGFLPADKRPQVVNPERGWVANWNNLPSQGWTNGDGPARERLGGNLHRVRLLQSLVRDVAKDPSYEASRAIELTSGSTAQQFPFLNQRRVRNAKRRSKDSLAKATLKQLQGWDGSYVAVDAQGTVDPGRRDLGGVQGPARDADAQAPRLATPRGRWPASRAARTSSTSPTARRSACGPIGPKGYAKAAKRTAKALDRGVRHQRHRAVARAAPDLRRQRPGGRLGPGAAVLRSRHLEPVARHGPLTGDPRYGPPAAEAASSLDQWPGRRIPPGGARAVNCEQKLAEVCGIR